MYKALTALLLIVLVVSFSWPQAAFSAESLVDDTTFATEGQVFQGGQNAACVNDNTCFVFYIGAEGDLEMASTTDGGATWSAGRTVDSVNTTDVAAHAIWYEGWTATTTPARYIHIASADTGVDDIYYTRYDTQTNTLSTTVVTTAQTGAFLRGTNQSVDIIQTDNGRLYVGTIAGDAWVDTCTTTCTDTANWSEATTNPFVTGNHAFYMAPIGGTDNLMGIQRNFSTDVLSYAIYSATSSSWSATTTLDTGVAENLTHDFRLTSVTFASTTGLIFLTAVDDVTSYITGTSDLESYTYSSTTDWTINTPVLVNASGAITGTKAAVDMSSSTSPVLYAFYLRRTTAGVATTTNMYYSFSTTTGSTWSSEQGPVNDAPEDIELMMSNGASADILGGWFRYVNAPNQDDLYYDLAVDLTPYSPPGGGGATSTDPGQSEFFF